VRHLTFSCKFKGLAEVPLLHEGCTLPAGGAVSDLQPAEDPPGGALSFQGNSGAARRNENTQGHRHWTAQAVGQGSITAGCNGKKITVMDTW
jgi:hypothetical protein